MNAASSFSQELSEEGAFIQYITYSMGDGVIVDNAQGKITFANAAAQSLLGCNENTLMGSDINKIFYCNGTPDKTAKLKYALTHLQTYRNEDGLFFPKDSPPLPVAYTVAPMLDDRGYIGSITVFRDITERKKAEQKQQALIDELRETHTQLIHSEKMAGLGTMAAGVAHEINNPIGFVKNNASVLAEYMQMLLPLLHDYHTLALSKADQQPDLLESILGRLGNESLDYLIDDINSLIEDTMEGTKRIQGIVAGLKSFARVDESEQKLFDLNECVETTLKVVWNELKYKCTVHKHLGEIPEVLGNPGQFNQVIMNLLVNAAQAIKEQGDVTIETRLENDEVLLAISDTGQGIPDDNIKKIFTPFFTSKPVGTGTGLGLSISHGIVKDHNGTINVESIFGKGTTFTIHLPTTPPIETSQPDIAALRGASQ